MSGPRIGLISNPRSRAERSGRARFGASAAALPHAAPATPEALAEALAGFARQGVELLAVQGGDGTLREVLTALPGAFGDRQPAIALLAAGKTNLAARVLGTAGAGEAGLARLLAAAREGRLRRQAQPLLEVARTGAPPLRGLLFGAGAFTEAKRLADAGLHRRGINNRAAVLLALLGTAWQVLVREGHPVRAGLPMALAPAGVPPPDGRRFLALATPLDRLMLGLWPFWGAGEGRLHWLDVPAPPPRLARGLLAAWRGRPAPWMPAAGYASGRAEALVLHGGVPFVLDGEVFDPGPDGEVRITAAGPASFAWPA